MIDVSKLFSREGVIYRLVPEISACDHCALNDRDCAGVRCGKTNTIAIEDTPEALAKYIALRMTK